ncbi:hypothetical protein FZC84_00670 [Rossellomorea vietnamensis]|uniref:Uncharacterized protein n=1 Tax=Rossellomorea vietnamensis TaxID=218284 RepID=A0A5D4MJQ7_9BACI|nr:hypothetical protein [Rossellomorea vietnamensis]TYS01216.1 hypothetical protein FZC84_00670 [Rossellomorea vietnamensis]
MAYFHIGSLTIPSTWLAAILALIAAAMLYRLKNGMKTGDWYWNSFFLYVVVWKLSYIFLHPALFLDMPLSVLYFNGGKAGHIAGLAAISVFLFMKRRVVQGGPGLLLPLFFLSYEVIVNGLERNFIELISHFFLLALFLSLFRKIGGQPGGMSIRIILFLVLCELLIISVFKTLLTLETLTLIWLALLALVDLIKSKDSQDDIR